MFNDLLEAGRSTSGYRPTCKTRATRVTHRVKRVPPVTSYLAVVQPAPRSPGKIGSASIDHASRWDLGRSSPLHSSTNGKTGIHVNGLRGLCRPLPPHSFLLLFFSLSLSLFSSFFLLISVSRALLLVLAALCLSLCTHNRSPSLPLSLTLSVSLPSSTFRSVYPSSGPRR